MRFYIRHSTGPRISIKDMLLNTWGWLLEIRGEVRDVSEQQAICYTLVCCLADFLLWRWSWYVRPKRRFTCGLHGAMSQKMATFNTWSRIKFSGLQRYFEFQTSYQECPGTATKVTSRSVEAGDVTKIRNGSETLSHHALQAAGSFRADNRVTQNGDHIHSPSTNRACTQLCKIKSGTSHVDC
jgi:hypothetical protein